MKVCNDSWQCWSSSQWKKCATLQWLRRSTGTWHSYGKSQPSSPENSRSTTDTLRIRSIKSTRWRWKFESVYAKIMISSSVTAKVFSIYSNLKFSSVFDLSCLSLGFRWTLTSNFVHAKVRASKPLTICLIMRLTDQWGMKWPHSTWPLHNRNFLPWTKKSNCNLLLSLKFLSHTEHYLWSTQCSSQSLRTLSKIWWWWTSSCRICESLLDNQILRNLIMACFNFSVLILLH